MAVRKAGHQAGPLFGQVVGFAYVVAEACVGSLLEKVMSKSVLSGLSPVWVPVMVTTSPVVLPVIVTDEQEEEFMETS